MGVPGVREAVAEAARGLLTTGQAARRLGVSNQRVDQLRRRGALPPALVTPLGRLFDPADVERLARERGEREGGR